jgi:26S proteasome regulatory subunit N5
MIQYALQHSEYLDATKYYYKVWETPSIKADTNGRGREVSSCDCLRISF